MASTLNISLPDPIKSYVEAEIQAGDYGSPSQYISELVLDARHRRLALKDLLLQSLGNEERSLEISDDDWQNGDIIGLIEEHSKTIE